MDPLPADEDLEPIEPAPADEDLEPIPDDADLEPIESVPRGDPLTERIDLANDPGSVARRLKGVADATMAIPAELWPSAAEEALAQKNERLRTIQRANWDADLEKRSNELRLARETSVPHSIVAADYAGFKAAWDGANFDWSKWRTENPDVAKLADEDGRLAPLVLREEQISVFAKAIRGIYRLEKFDEAQRKETRKSMRTGEPEVQLRRPDLFNAPDQYMRDDPAADLGSFDKISSAYAKANKGIERSKLGATLAYRMLRGEDTTELEAEIAKLGADLEPTYLNAGPLEQVGIDAANILPSMLETVKTAGATGAAGAVVGGAIGLKSKSGVVASAGTGLKWGARLGAAGGSFRIEMGGALIETLGAKTDDGKPVDRKVALGSAIAYGVVAGAIESATFGAEVSMFGPLGDAVRKGNGKAFLKSMLKNSSARALFNDIATRYAKGVGAEVVEEVSQEASGDLFNYIAKSLTAGSLQKTNPEAELVSLVEVGVSTAKGMAALAPGSASVNIGTHLGGQRLAKIYGDAVDRADAAKGGEVVAATLGLKDSPTVRAAPEAVASMISSATAETGQTVENLYVDAAKFMRFFQEQNLDPAEAAGSLLGRDGVFALEEALTTGGKIEVPVAQYLEKWGATDVAKALAEDTTTQRHHQTKRELRETEPEIQAQAEALAEQVEAETQNPGLAVDQALEKMEDGIVETGLHTKAEARSMMQALRAAARVNPQLFEDAVLEAGRGDDSASVPDGAFAQPEKPPDSETIAEMRRFYEGLSRDEQKRRLFTDRNTGLLNSRGFKVAPRDPARTFLAEFEIEGGKFFNDAHGHAAGDGGLRTMAGVLAQHVPDGAKMGGSLRAWVANPEQAQQIAEAMTAVVGDGVRVTGAATEGGESLKDAFEATGAAHKAYKSGERAAGRLGQRKGAPSVFMAGAPAISFEEGMEGVPLDSPEAQAFMSTAAEAARPVAERLKASKRVEGLSLAEEHEQAFGAGKETAFDDIYREPSGLLTEEGFALRQELAPKAFTVSADMRGLGPMNVLFKKDGADEILRIFSELLAEQGGTEVDAAHPHGDEFYAHGNDEQALDGFFSEFTELMEKQVFVRELSPGRFAIQEGVHFAHGIGKDLDEADRIALPEAKRKQGPVRGPREVTTEELERDLKRYEAAGDYNVHRLEAVVGQAAGEDQSKSSGQRNQVTRLEQDGATGSPHGYTEISQSGLRRLFKIALNKNANLSTFLHESGHVFFELIADTAAREGSSERIRSMYADTLKWMGVADRKDVKTEHHEKFARTFEAYLRKGEAPSSKLVAVFQKYKLWLKSIYRTFTSLNADLSPEISSVFDRLLATDEEIARTKKAMGLSPAFRSPIDAGMSPEQWQAYLEAQEDSTSHASLAADFRAAKDKLREQEKWWKDEEKSLRKAAEIAYEELPARIAQVLNGRNKLPKPENGSQLDGLAEVTGFPTGAALLEAMAGLPVKKVWATEKAAEQMQERHPDILKERAELRELVAKGLHGDATARWMLAEWAAIRSRAGINGAPPLESIKRAAKMLAQRKTIGKLGVGAALQAERSAGEKALKAVSKGNWEQAVVYKQQQILNQYIYRELSTAREELDSFMGLVDGLSTAKSQQRLGKAGAVYRDGVDKILESFGLKDEDSKREVELPSLAQVTAAMEEDGTTILFDTELVSRLLATEKQWKLLTVAEMRAVADALKNIRGAARAKATSLIDGKRRDKEETIAALLDEAAKNLPYLGPSASSEDAKGYWRKLKGTIAGIDADLLKPETMIGWLAGGDLKSTWFKAIILPLQKAKAAEVALLKKTIKPIIQAFEKMPKAVRDRTNESVDGRALFPNHRVDIEPPTKRFELLAMALNAGNASNLKRLLEGRGISAAELRNAIDTELTKDDLEWVQSIWDGLETLWPESSALEERVTGLRPPKIEATPLVTKHGTFSGGYYPVAYHQGRESAGKKQAAAEVASLMDPTFTRPGTSHGHLKSRADNFSGAIDLRLSVIGSHLAQAAHDIAYREAVQSVGGLIIDPKVQGAMTDRLGEERTAKFLQWIKDVGQMRGAAATAHAKGITRLALKLKSNTIVGVLGWSARTALGDFANLAAALPGSKFRLKPKHWAAGIAEFAISPSESSRLAEEKSPELRTRRDQIQRELMGQINKLTAGGVLSKGPLAWFKEHAFVFMEWSDKATSTPIWIGAYRQALAKGEADADAVVYADALIRKLFPSHSAVDTAAVIRDRGFVGSSLMFYGYMNVAYNIRRDIAHEVHMAKGVGGTVAATAKALAISLSFSAAAMVLSEVFSGRGPEEEETTEEWLQRKMLVAQFQDVPFLGDAAAGAESWFRGKRSNPRASVVVEAANTIGGAVLAIGDDEKDTKARVMAVIKGLGPIVGLPTAAPTRLVKYLWDLADGDVQAEEPLDVPKGLIYGEKVAR